MTNPWLNISHSDYEKHMFEVGQSQVINTLTKECLQRFKPQKFALLGCSTGNGLEHVNNDITENVYAIDINPKFLKITKERFSDKIPNLKTLKLDIGKDELKITDVNLFFVALVLEYTNPVIALQKIIETLSIEGVLVIVIQKSNKSPFVSKTKYKSLEKLSEISNETDETVITSFLAEQNINLIERQEIELKNKKKFISLIYKKS